VDDPVSWLGLTRCPSGPYKRSSEDAPTRTPVANHLITPAAIAIARAEIDDRYTDDCHDGDGTERSNARPGIDRFFPNAVSRGRSLAIYRSLTRVSNVSRGHPHLSFIGVLVFACDQSRQRERERERERETKHGRILDRLQSAENEKASLRLDTLTRVFSVLKK